MRGSSALRIMAATLAFVVLDDSRRRHGARQPSRAEGERQVPVL